MTKATSKPVITYEQQAWNREVTMRKRKKHIARLEKKAQAQVQAHMKAHNITQGAAK